MIKRFFLTTVGLFLVLSNSAIAEEPTPTEQASPYQVVSMMSEGVFQRFQKGQSRIKKDPDYLKVIVTESVVPYFDNRYAAYKVLGNRYLKQTNAEQRDRFVEAFTGYMVTLLAQAFSSYTDQSYRIDESKVIVKEKLASVPMKILAYKKPSISVKFNLRRTKKGEWLIFDLVIENISILVSKQKEITQMLRKNKGNVNAVIELLKEKSATHISIDKSKEKQ